jgi:hypothetical protein
MITQEQLESLGFQVNSGRTSPYYGGYIDFYKHIDNGHVISGHDTTEVFVTRDGHFVMIELDHHSSYDYSGKRLGFKGTVYDIEFFTQILQAVLRY